MSGAGGVAAQQTGGNLVECDGCHTGGMTLSGYTFIWYQFNAETVRLDSWNEYVITLFGVGTVFFGIGGVWFFAPPVLV